ncbi:hypothetical protein PHLCEN_2v2608 [Hermanssonia centrifuga]|uniref:Uncharacterized protein n=1 Tax=Hermanssonia centrifuga TaxID=98765 RepID=A0A2R6RIN8_9APHY|nr:hypothetical protein PHLCEN_2v2608 [Hermanssonia centrifuga]
MISAKESGEEAFWHKHCYTVPLGNESAKQKSEKPRKLQTCARCHKIKYAGGVGSGKYHRKLYCSDGVKMQDKADTPSRWPQPEGIFTTRSHFHPLVFLEELRRLYEKAVIQGDSSFDNMKSELFMEMLKARLETMELEKDSQMVKTVVFRLFPYLTMSLPLKDTIAIKDRKQYLRVDCLPAN